MGVNQNYQPVACAQAANNLAQMTGNIGRPGTGANSITGQANAMGSKLFSNIANLLGGRGFATPPVAATSPKSWASTRCRASRPTSMPRSCSVRRDCG